MFNGLVNKSKKKPCFTANRNGFISAYALMILQITLVFILLMTQTCTSFYNTHKKHRTQFLDIAILYDVKNHLHSESNGEVPKEGEEEKDDERENNKDVWSLIYEGIDVTLEREHNIIYASFILNGEEKRLRITLDDTASCIMKYAYL